MAIVPAQVERFRRGHLVYRLVLGRRSSEGDAIVNVTASCEGTGCMLAPPTDPSCAIGDYDCLVGGAVDPLDGANDRKTRPIDVADLQLMPTPRHAVARRRAGVSG